MQFQKKIYRQLKRKSESYAGRPPKLLLQYKKEYFLASNREFSYSNQKDLLQNILNNQIVLIGDHHTFEQSQKNLIRIMKMLTRINISFNVCLEMIPAIYQKTLDNYLDEQITEQEFLEEIKYKSTWIFPWTHYKKIFDFAKQKKIRIIALNSIGDLTQREKFAANLIVENVSKKNILSLVLFGEYHLCSHYLPQKISLKTMTIFQHMDEPYWKVENHKTSPIIQFSPSEFGIISSPPWLKYESTIYWYEHLYDDPDFDIHEYLIQTGLKTFNSSIHDSFLLVCLEIKKLLQFKISNKEIEDFEVHDHTKIDVLSDSIEHLFMPKKIRDFYNSLIVKGTPFKLLDRHDYFCSQYNINKLTLLGGIHLYYLLLEKRKISYKEIIIKNQNQKAFFLFFYQFMFGYLVCKIFNPFIKCDLYRDLYQKKDSILKFSPDESLLNKTTLALLENPFQVNELLKNKKLLTIYRIAQVLGEFSGESYYQEVFINKKVIKNFSLNDLAKLNINGESFTDLMLEIFPDKKFKLKSKRTF